MYATGSWGDLWAHDGSSLVADELVASHDAGHEGMGERENMASLTHVLQGEE